MKNWQGRARPVRGKTHPQVNTKASGSNEENSIRRCRRIEDREHRWLIVLLPSFVWFLSLAGLIEMPWMTRDQFQVVWSVMHDKGTTRRCISTTTLAAEKLMAPTPRTTPFDGSGIQGSRSLGLRVILSFIRRYLL